MSAGHCRAGERLRFVAESEADPGRLLVDDLTAGWYEIFDDPLLDAAVLRIWLDVVRLDPDQRQRVAQGLTPQLASLASSSPKEPRWSTIESNRIFCPRGASAASVLLRLDPKVRRPCGRCEWVASPPDRWFIDELASSFVSGCSRLAVAVDPDRARHFVVDELIPQADWSWWSLQTGARRSGILLSTGHEDLVDGRAYAQCVDAVGAHSEHFSCLAAEVAGSLGCEVRGEVTVGVEWPQERAVIRRLHDDGWRIRGLTSLFPNRSLDLSEGGEPCASKLSLRSG